MGKTLVWGGLALLILVPFFFAATSPLLAWREPVYILAGFAGVVALALLMLQPLLIAGLLPGLTDQFSRRLHFGIGLTLVGTVLIHVIGLWITSPPDVIDVLLLRSPTPFSLWGVAAMWAVFAAALAATLRKRWRIPPRLWRVGHTGLAIVIVAGTITHALLIDGTMETLSKAVLCLAVALGLLRAIAKRRIWAMRRR